MKKYLILVSFLLMVGYLVAADLVAGQTYKISLATAPKKGLFVENASLSNNANIVLWTETNVNAQRWILVSGVEGGFQLKNAYSGKYLASKGTVASGTGICQVSSSEGAITWNLSAVDNSEAYYMKTLSGLYLGGDNMELDGAAVRLVSNLGSAYKWKVDAVEAQPNSLTETARDEMMAGWKRAYYHENPGRIGEGGFWGDAEMFEIILDAYETTGDNQYKLMFDKLHADFIKRQGNDWKENAFNDDIAWIVIASIRGYLMTGTVSYLNVAKSNFDMMYNRAAVLPEGMLVWNADGKDGRDPLGTTSCINGPAEVAACYLAIATGDENYYEKARSLYAAQRKYLYKPSTGQVYDGFSWKTGTPSNYNPWASTYNQGTFLGAAVMLYNHYGDVQYKEDAKKIMEYTRKNMCDEFGIIKACPGIIQTDGPNVGELLGDLPGFKGILMRYVRRYMVDMCQPEVASWLAMNAFHAYNNRNSDGVSCTAWLTKTVEEYTTSKPFTNYNKDPFGPSTAVSVAFNSYIGNKTVRKDAFVGVQAENFDYLKGAYTQSMDGIDTPVMLCGDNVSDASTGYFNVDFGSYYAKSIQLKVLSQRPSSVIEVRLDSPNGELLATVTPTYTSGGNDFETITAELSRPLDGVHRIYLKFLRPVGGAAKILIDSFCFIREGFTTQDVTDNGGLITSSVVATDKSSGVDAVIDNRITTGLVGTVSGSAWIQYQSPHPVLLKGYQLIASGGMQNGDPKSWKLQASEDGNNWIDLDDQKNQEFAARYQKKQYNVITTKTYSCFRLLISERQGSDTSFQLAEWQLFGTALASSCITTDGGTLQAQYPDGVGNVIDKDAVTFYQAPTADFWLSYQSEVEYTLSSYSITTGDTEANDPKSWEFYGSKDGMEWVLLDQRTEQMFPYRKATYTYSLTSSSTTDTGYSYFKLHITANNGASETQLAEWQLLGELIYIPQTFYNDITMSGGKLTSSSNEGDNSEALCKLTDNNENTFYTFSDTEKPWIQYQAPTKVTLKSLALVSADDPGKDPTTILVEYKEKEGVSFRRAYLGPVNFAKRNERVHIALDRVVSGSIIRVTVTAVADASTGINGSGAKLAEIELYGNGIITNDLTVGGSMTALYESTNTSETSDKLIDKKDDTKFCGNFPISSWLCCEVPNPVKVNLYSLTSGNDAKERDPSTWVLEASNNGSDWTTIDTREAQSFSDRQTTQYYSCNKDENSYSYFRLRVTENHGADMLQLSEWQLQYIEKGPVGIIKPAGVMADARLNEDILTVDVPEEAQVQVYTLSGIQVLAETVPSGTSTLSVNNLDKGIYVVRLCLPKQVISLKVVK